MATPYVIRQEACLLFRISSGVRPCWELEEPQGPKEAIEESPESLRTVLLSSLRVP